MKVHEKSIAIVGWHEGDAGQIHAWLSERGEHIACFVNPSDTPPEIDIAQERPRREASQFSFPDAQSFKGLPLINVANWQTYIKDLGIQRALVLIPDERTRFEHIEGARKAGIELINAIHPLATIMEDAIIHDNVVLYAHAFIGYRAEIHAGVVINTGAQIDHHNVIYPCARIDPAVATAGNVVVERFARVHMGARIINNKRIGEAAIVAAGAVVIRDVQAGEMVGGVPAHPLTKKSNPTPT